MKVWTQNVCHISDITFLFIHQTLHQTYSLLITAVR